MRKNSMQNNEIIKDDRRKRFFIPLDGKEAHLKYRMKDENTIEYFSTFVPEEYRGK
jgi:predicted GNAT family acetyltransferase